MTNPPIIQAIRTTFEGIIFRSRTEARWAVFFDAAGIAWRYEAEGYEIPLHGRYLPDFWLPQFDAFFEVKGTSEYNDELLMAAAQTVGKDIFIGIGSPRTLLDFYVGGVCPEIDVCFAEEGWDNGRAFETCKHGHISLEYAGQSQRHCGRAFHTETPQSNHDLLQRAAFRADTYRFWDPVHQ